jgi:hypothetical protein
VLHRVVKVHVIVNLEARRRDGLHRFGLRDDVVKVVGVILEPRITGCISFPLVAQRPGGQLS